MSKVYITTTDWELTGIVFSIFLIAGFVFLVGREVGFEAGEAAQRAQEAEIHRLAGTLSKTVKRAERVDKFCEWIRQQSLRRPEGLCEGQEE